MTILIKNMKDLVVKKNGKNSQKMEWKGQLDYFGIEIKHHKGDLQMNNTTKVRERVY